MASSDDDEDLKAAIALSLADQAASPSGSRSPVHNHAAGHSKRNPIVVDLIDDSDEADEEYMPEAARSRTTSLTEAPDEEDATKPGDPETVPSSEAVHGHVQASDTVKTSFQLLDRKKMEEERLARLKRKASVSPPRLRRDKQRAPCPVSPPRPRREKEPRQCPESGPPVSSSTKDLQENTIDQRPATVRPASEAAVHLPSTSSGLQFPHGVVRKTWAFGYPREDDIKIEEVLQKNDLSTAVLSAFQWDVEWLMSKIDLNKTKMIFVMQAKDEATVGA